MANYSNLKTAIENAVDWNNGDNEITGQNLLDILETIIDSLGAKYKFADVATPSSSISTPDEPLFYLAGAGTYANFSGLTVSVQRGTLAIFYYDTAWHWTSVRTDSDAFFNVNQYLEAPSTTYTKATGRNAVPEALRSKGMIITYLTTNGWIIEQNLSTSGTWNADANWQTIGPVSVSQNTSTGKTELKIGDTPALIVDNEPEFGSENLVESGGVFESISNVEDDIAEHLAHNVLDEEDELYTLNKIIKSDGTLYSDTYNGYATTGFIPCRVGMKFRPAESTTDFEFWVCFFDSEQNAISADYLHLQQAFIEVPEDGNIRYMRVSMTSANLNHCLYNSSLPIDIVVGYNEAVLKVYAVDSEKYVVLDDRLVALEDYVNSHRFEIIENLFDPSEITDNKYVDPADGLEKSGNTFITDYIPCKAGDVLVWQGISISTLCALYDSEKNFIRGYYEDGISPYNTIPDSITNVAYIRFSPPQSQKIRALYKTNHSVNIFVEYNEKCLIIGDGLFGDIQISTLGNRVTELENKSVPFVTNLIDTNADGYALNKIIKNDGSYYSATYSGYMTTDYISCEKGQKFRFDESRTVEIWCCFFDGDKNAQSSLYINDSAVNEITIPNDNDTRFMRISYKKTDNPNECLYQTELTLPALPFGERLYTMDGCQAEKSKINELDVHSFTIDGVNPFVGVPKWEVACCRPICIGDSLTDGLYVPNSQGQYVQGLINENYPFFLGRLLNCDVFNAGKSGSYPSKFYSEWYPLIDFTEYDSVFLWLGTNGGLNTADASAVNHSPEKEGYYYTQIIDGILTQNPNIKITLLNVFIVGEISSGVTPATVSVTNTFIENIATTYGLQVIDMSDLTTNTHLDLRNGISNTHFAKAGNIFIADRIVNNLREWFNANPIRCEFGLTQKPDHNP